jgi:hypothetical protein
MAQGRIALFGNGSLDMDATRRDGSIGDRRELFRGLRTHGVDAVYLGPPHLSRGDLRDAVVGWRWRGSVDALVIEARRPIRPPDRAPEKNVVHEQAVVLRDWYEGRFGSAVPLFLVDFDYNVRTVFGLGGRTSEYISIRSWQDLTPWMPDVLPRIQTEAVVLAPYEPSLSRITTHRQPGQNYRVVRWLWPYPTELEVESLPWSERAWELAYPGNDYNRREKFWRYYVEGARAKCHVAVTGIWDDRKIGREAGEWGEPGFRSRVKEAAGDRLSFTGEGRKGIPYLDVQALLRQTKAVVQIVPSVSEMPYERIGYYTVRVAETAAAGAIPFVDRDISAHEDLVPSDWFRVSSFEELRTKMLELRGRELEAVGRWRDHLRTVGTGAERARQLLDLIA